MLAKLTDADKIFRDLDDQIAAERETLVRQIDESNKRTVALLLRRGRLKEALREVSTAVVTEASPAQDERAAQTGVPGKASAIIVEALRKTTSEGLAGGALNKKILDAGLSVAAADKAKARLKQAGIVKLEDGMWRLTEKAKKEGAGAR
jgi:hypothetical protein